MFIALLDFLLYDTARPLIATFNEKNVTFYKQLLTWNICELGILKPDLYLCFVATRSYIADVEPYEVCNQKSPDYTHTHM